MKQIMSTTCAILLSIPALAANGKIVVPIHASADALFPAGISLHLAVTANDLIMTQLESKCGTDPQVSDVDVFVRVIHNQVPGTARVDVRGTAVCLPK